MIKFVHLCFYVVTFNFYFSDRVGGGGSGSAMVLGKVPVPGRPTIWITVGKLLAKVCA